MPVVVSTLTAVEQAAQVARKPVLLGANSLRSPITPAEWSTALTWATGVAGGPTNQSRPTAPPRWVYDGRLDARSRPNNAAVSSYFLLFELDAGVVDAAVVANHNFAEIPGCIVRLGLADDSSFTVNVRVIAQWAGFGAQRLVALDLTDGGPHGQGEYRRFTGVRYAYLEVVTSGTFGAVAPRVGEVFLGRGRRLARSHDYPGDERALESRVDEYEADGGGVARMVRHRGRRVLDLQWTADSEDLLGDDIATWRALFEEDLEDGTLPAFYLRDPQAPEDAPLMLLDPVQRFDWAGPHHAQRSVEGRELPPFVRSEVGPVLNSLDDPWADWYVAYAGNDIAGTGPYTWPPALGTGPNLSLSVGFDAQLPTAPLLPAGIGSARVDGAYAPGTEAFRGGPLSSWPAGAFHLRVLFRPTSETIGYLFAYAVNGVELFQGRFNSNSLTLHWRHDADGGIYIIPLPLTNNAWTLLDVIISPTGGPGGVSTAYVYANGVSYTPANHSVGITVGGGGTLGIGGIWTGTNPMLGEVLFFGLRPATGIDLATHQAHAAGVGV